MKIKACPQCQNPHFYIWGEKEEKCEICAYFGKFLDFKNVEEYQDYCKKNKINKKKT